MLKILLDNKKKILLSALIVLGLIGVRAFEDWLFYDPFLDYFKRDYTTLRYPPADDFLLLVNYLFRYTLNAGLSVALLHVIFANRDITKFSAVLYAGFFVIFLLAFLLIWKDIFGEQKTMLFYARRFLIQPILILLFIPAFYVQQRSEKNNIL